METTLRDLQHAGLDSVHQAVLTIDAPGPEPLQIALQRFGLTQSGEWMTLNIFNQRVDLDDSTASQELVWTSCTMILPLLEKGAAGSAVRPVAIGVPGEVITAWRRL